MEKTKRFIDGFIEETKNPLLGNVYGEYITQMAHFDRFIFVEGPDDINYYSALFSFAKETYIKCGGKSNVIYMHNYLAEYPQYVVGEKKYHYLVDRDYNCLENYALSENHKITMTKYYSFENYAFEKKNIKVILKLHGLEDREKDFMQNLNHYFEDIKLYEILKILATNDIIDIKLPKLTAEQFIKDNSNQIVIKDSFKHEVDKAFKTKKYKKKNGIKTTEQIFNNYYRLTNEIITTPIEIRGHDLEIFLNEILRSYGKSETLVEILSNKEKLSQLHIDLELR